MNLLVYFFIKNVLLRLVRFFQGMNFTCMSCLKTLEFILMFDAQIKPHLLNDRLMLCFELVDSLLVALDKLTNNLLMIMTHILILLNITPFNCIKIILKCLHFLQIRISYSLYLFLVHREYVSQLMWMCLFKLFDFMRSVDLNFNTLLIMGIFQTLKLSRICVSHLRNFVKTWLALILVAHFRLT